MMSRIACALLKLRCLLLALALHRFRSGVR
jgi:hypothetical protein